MNDAGKSAGTAAASLAGLRKLSVTLPENLSPETLACFKELEQVISGQQLQLERAEQARISAELSLQKYRNIFDSMEDAYYEATLDGKILEISPSIAKIARGLYTREDLIGASIIDFYHNPEDRVRFFEEVRKNGSVTDYDVDLINKDGIKVYTAISTWMIPDKPGEPGKIIGSIRDITKRKDAEEKLRERENLWSGIINNSPDGIVVVDLTGNIRFATQTIVSWYEYDDVSEMIGKNLFEFVGPEWQEISRKLFADLLNGVNRQVLECEVIKKSGGKFFVEVRGEFLRDKDGIPESIFLIQRDITEKKRADEAAAQQNKNLLFLNQFSTSIGQLHFSKSISKFVVDQIRNFTNADFVIFSRFIQEKSQFSVTFVETSPEISDILNHPDNIHWKDLEIPTPDVARKAIMEETIRLTDSICDLTFGFFTPEENDHFKQQTGLTQFLGISLTSDDKLFGGMIIGFHSRQDLPSGHLLRSFANVSAVAISRKIAEKNLWQSHRELEQRVAERSRELAHLYKINDAIIKNAGLGILSTDAKGTILTFNTAAEKMLGYQAEEVIGKWTPTLFHDTSELLSKAPEYGLDYLSVASKTPEQIAGMFAELKAHTTEWTCIRKDNSRFPIKLSVASFRDEEEKTEGFIGVFMDISQEKAVLDSLRESEERFHKMFFEHEAVMMLVNPANGEIVDANPAAEAFYGYNFNEIEQFNISTLNILSQAEIAVEMSNATMHKRNYFEFQHRLASGEVRHVEVHSSPVEIDGEMLLFSIIHDITERKHAEVALKVSERNLAQITDGIPILVAVTDASLNLIFTNSAYANFFGHPKEYFMGKPIQEIYGPETYKLCFSYLQRALQGEVVSYDKVLDNAFGETRNIYTTYNPYFQGTEVVGVLISKLDITQRVMAEEQLKLREAENRAILTAVPDLMFRLSKEGKFLSALITNPKDLYVEQDQFMGLKVEEVLPPNVAQLAMKSLQEAFETGKVVAYDYELPIGSEIRYYENRTIALSEHEALAIIRDISSRKYAENALLWNEEFLKKMTESSPLAFLVVDNRTDEILYINHHFCEIWGINHLEEAIRNHELKNNDIIPDCIPVVKDLAAFAESCTPLQEVDNRSVIEDEIAFNDGRVIRRFSTQIRDNNDQYHGRLYIFEDITRRKRSEELIILQRDLATKLSATRNLDQALTETLEALFQIEGVDGGGIYLEDPITKSLILVKHLGLSEEFVKERTVYPPDTKQAQMVRKGKPFYSSSQLGYNPDLADLIGLAVIPICHESRTIGSINLASRTSVRFYEDIRLALESLAFQLGGTISRISAENALITSQQNFQLLFNTIDDFLFILDDRGVILMTNSIVEKRLKYTQEELVGMDVLYLHPPETREEARFIIGEIIAGRSSSCPIALYSKDGEQIPVETRVIAGKWDDKNVLFGISRDVTERQAAEAALRMQSVALESFALPIIITDKNGVMKWSNSAFSRLSGYLPEESIGRPIGKLVGSGVQSAEFYKEMWQTLLAGKVWSGELVNRKKDGKLYSEELTISPVLDFNGNLSSFVAIKIDITSRKMMQIALQESEALWSFALEVSGDGVYDWDMVHNTVFYSDKYKRTLGYEPDEFDNRLQEWEIRVHEADREQVFQALNEHLSGSAEIYSLEYRMRCKDGSWKWILDRGKVVAWDPKGKPSRIIGTQSDISARKSFEESLRSAIARERELNELKSRFVSMASHEFRTPLASIQMVSDSLRSYWKRMDDIQIQLKLQNISEQVQHLTKIVADVMQVSKIQEGKVSFNPQSIDVVDLCRKVVDNFNSHNHLRDMIKFVNRLSEPVYFRLDKRIMLQILNNLFANAIKYSQPTPVVEAELKLSEPELLLIIRDNGIGIPEADQKNLFQPFFRAENARQIQGNGLGLNIVKESLALHGGEISFESIVNVGSTFTVHLPISLKD
ncbi:MAG: PAS domain S-box protein [Marinilabiliales bacterium]|nr:PAS domain S-box protein [Marinilabiliales bacterium]